MPKKARDYKAEYARRQSLAKERGYKSYGQQRRLIEKGIAPAIQPTRLRSARTIRNQEESGAGFLFRATGFRTINDYRIDAAQRWSDMRSRRDVTKFDADRARRDPEYLDAYSQALVSDAGNPDVKFQTRLSYNDYTKHYLVDVMHAMTEDEYEARYGKKK